MLRRKPHATPNRSAIAERLSGPLAIDQMAMSIYWDWGIGCDNATIGTSRVVTIDGPLERSSFCYDGYDAIVDRFTEACGDTSTSSVILRFSSPGGEVSGLYEAIDKMATVAAKSGKRIVAVADDCAYSAAYALSCVASEVYLSRSSGVGSVGVLCVLADYVKMNERIGVNVAVIHAGDRKVDGHPDVPLSPDAIAVFQTQVDSFAEMFYEIVASARGLDTSDVAGLQAGIFLGEDAIAAGLADGVMTFDEVVTMLAIDAAATTNTTEEDDMKSKTGRKSAAERGATDAFANAAVMPVSVAAMTAIAGILDPTATNQPATPVAAPVAAAPVAEATDDEAETEDEDAEAEADDGDAGDDADEGDDKDKKDDDADAAAVAVPKRLIAAGSNSGDVLRAIKEITGESSPAAQIGALVGLAEKAATADAATRQAATARRAAASTEKATLIKSALASGQLAPSQKAWAQSCTVASLKGYLKNAPKALVKRAATAHGKPVARATAETDLDASLALVAKACAVDPKALAEHAKELAAKGLIVH